MGERAYISFVIFKGVHPFGSNGPTQESKSNQLNYFGFLA